MFKLYYFRTSFDNCSIILVKYSKQGLGDFTGIPFSTYSLFRKISCIIIPLNKFSLKLHTNDRISELIVPVVRSMFVGTNLVSLVPFYDPGYVTRKCLCLKLPLTKYRLWDYLLANTCNIKKSHHLRSLCSMSGWNTFELVFILKT